MYVSPTTLQHVADGLGVARPELDEKLALDDPVLRVLAEEVTAPMREKEQARLYADTGAADHARQAWRA